MEVNYFFLCGPIPNEPRTGTRLGSGGWGPLVYEIKNKYHSIPLVQSGYSKTQAGEPIDR